MKLIRPIIAALALAFALPAGAVPSLPAPSAPERALVPVQANCASIGQQIAAQRGGTLAKATAEQRGGQSVCVLIVLVPPRDGGHPRREEVVVPQ